MSLIYWASPHRFLGISKLGWLELSLLPNLSMGTEYSVICSPWQGVARSKIMRVSHSGLQLWSEPLAQTLNRYVVVPKVVFSEVESLLLVFSSQVVIKQVFFTCILKRWTATRFSAPFLPLISRSNYYRSWIQRMSCGLASFLVKRYFGTTWSMCTITSAPTK